MTSRFRGSVKEALAFAAMRARTSEALDALQVQPTFAGFDTGSYPGDAAMTALQVAGFSISSLYLTHGPGRESPQLIDHRWILKANTLRQAGWGLVPIYVGAQPPGSSSLGPPSDPVGNAIVDAQEAANLAGQAGLAPGSTLFLDVEHAFASGSPYESYVLKWLEVVTGSGFKTAIYCFPTQVAWAATQGIPIWTVHLNGQSGRKDDTGQVHWSELTSPLPADPIDPGATGTQTRFYCHAAETGIELDYDRWLVPDPSLM